MDPFVHVKTLPDAHLFKRKFPSVLLRGPGKGSILLPALLAFLLFELVLCSTYILYQARKGAFAMQTSFPSPPSLGSISLLLCRDKEGSLMPSPQTFQQ